MPPNQADPSSDTSDATITVGDISQAKGVAIGRGANAQVVEGDHNVVVGPGGVVINIPESRAPSGPHFMAPDLPSDFVTRPVEFEQIVAHLLESATGPVAIREALRGAGGYGKTTLAAAVCHDPRVRVAFPDGILWVTLGEKPSHADIVGKIEELVGMLKGGSRAGIVSLEAATTRLDEVIGEHRLLLVVDDVWDAEHLKPFLRGGSHTTRLITTRNRDTLPTETRAVDVDAMHLTEALALLSVGLSNTAVCADALRRLAARLGEWPLLLTIINRVLREQTAASGTLEGAIGYVNAGLDEEGMTAFDTQSAEGRTRAVARTLAVSLATFSDAEQQRFAELAIFPEDVSISLATLQRYWGATGGLSAFAVKRLATHLYNRSLLLTFELAAETIRLHGVIRNYLIHVPGATLAGWHTSLLDAHRSPSGAWPDLPKDEPYLWGNLAYHLRAAGRVSELRTLLLDFRWMRAKLSVADIGALVADYDAAQVDDDTTLQLVRRTLELAANDLDRTGVGLASQLTGRLLGFELPETRKLLEQIRRSEMGMWLRPLAPSLTPPGSSLLRTFVDHSDPVSALTVAPDQGRIASGSVAYVYIWDLDRIASPRRLVVADDLVLALAFAPDSRTIVSGTSSGILCVLEAQTGACLRLIRSEGPAIDALAISPDGAICAAGSAHELCLWRLDDGSLVERLPAGWPLGFTPTGELLLRGTDLQLRRWRTGQGILDVPAPSGNVLFVPLAASPDGRLVLMMEAGAIPGMAEIETPFMVLDSVTFDVLGRFKTIWSFPPPADLSTTLRLLVTAIDNSGACAVVVSEREIEVWEAGAGTRRARLPGHEAGITALTFTSGGHRLISGAADHTLKLWAIDAPAPALQSESVQFSALASSSRGPHVFVNTDLTVETYDPPSFHKRHKFETIGVTIDDVVVARDGRRALLILRVLFPEQTELWLYQPDGSPVEKRLHGADEKLFAAAIVANGRKAMTAGIDGWLRVWDLDRGREQGRPIRLPAPPASRNALCLTADGYYAVYATANGPLVVFNLRRRMQTGTLYEYGQPVSAMMALSDGRRILTGGADGNVRLWDVMHCEQIGDPLACGAPVAALGVTPDDRLAVVAVGERGVQVWSLTERRQFTRFAGDSPMVACAIGPDGRTILAGEASGVYHTLRLEGDSSAL